MTMLQTLNPFKKKWWKKDEWAKVKEVKSCRTKDQYADYWELEPGYVRTYVNKNTEEERMVFHLHSKTVVRVKGDPTQKRTRMPYNTSTSVYTNENYYAWHASKYDLYEGPDYEE